MQSPWPLVPNNFWSDDARIKSQLGMVTSMLAQDPTTWLSKVKIFQSQVVLGMQVTYAQQNCEGASVADLRSSSVADIQAFAAPRRWGGRLIQMPRIYEKSGYYGYQSEERPAAELSLARGERITSVGAGTGEVLDTLVLRTNHGQELTAGNASRGNVKFVEVPAGHELIAFAFHMNGVAIRPHIVTLPRFWQRWGWLLLWRMRLAAAAPASTTTDLTAELVPSDADHSELCLARLVQLDDDLFRMVVPLLMT